MFDPILSQHCFKCHGPDDKPRKANLRLDLRTGSLASRSKRNWFRRIESDDDSELMPPPSVKKPLAKSQIAILKEWIAGGGEFRNHWSFMAPKQAALPTVKLKDWPRSPIDYFVFARLEAEGLKPSPQADRYTLVRRVYLDLIGLPPTPDEADAFVNDKSPDAYEKLVDRLLRFAALWRALGPPLARSGPLCRHQRLREGPARVDLALSRLGHQGAQRRHAVRSVHDRATRRRHAAERHRVQIGSRPASTATRCSTRKAGIDPLEFRFHAMTDRVATTGTAWLGLTIGCASATRTSSTRSRTPSITSSSRS